MEKWFNTVGGTAGLPTRLSSCLSLSFSLSSSLLDVQKSVCLHFHTCLSARQLVSVSFRHFLSVRVCVLLLSYLSVCLLVSSLDPSVTLFVFPSTELTELPFSRKKQDASSHVFQELSAGTL
ncbi:hypothetical protein GOODEAATRI_005884 [Goodea atripinnis]|uniref:Transmembrane protein n=1 Tax=Goodea atripinnis TaxID=208336 RepID=A0ABV0PLG4_9TELE